MNEKQNPEEQELSTEERFKQTVDRLRPYIQNLWAARWKLVIINGAVLVFTLAYLLFLAKPYYKSTVTILPDYGSKESTFSSLSSLASLAGVSVGAGSPTDIYQDLIFSEAVLGPAIYAKYKTEEFPDSVNLIQYFEIKSDISLIPELQKRKMFLTELTSLTKGRLVTDVDKITKILTITLTMPEAKLAADVVNKIAESLDNYIRIKRKSYSSEQRKYIEQRLTEVKDSLTNSENWLLSFKEQNKAISDSPALMLKQTRLSRSVVILDAVYFELSKQLELAKIDEVKDTPVLNIKELAKDPVVKDGPKRATALILIMFFSVLLSVVYLLYLPHIKVYYSLLTLKRQL